MPAKRQSERNTAIDYINRDIVNVKEELHTLSKIIRDGNGHPSLMQQVATINNDIEHLHAEIDGRFNETRDLLEVHYQELNSLITKCNAKHREDKKMDWQFKTAVWVSLIGSITSLLMHFFGK
jgi:predicted  nucleic acid-binding Zn-ribbon protein